jgi:hypothetical protein
MYGHGKLDQARLIGANESRDIKIALAPNWVQNYIQGAAR